jgi:Tfp pilus assembly protein PilF
VSRTLHRLAAPLLLAALAACGEMPGRRTGLMDVAERPAERALLAGMRAYDDGQYGPAEERLQQALQTGLASPKDRATAHKHLAFIFCTSKRVLDCEAQFRAARRVDPAFALSRSEAGHPVWGPVWQRVQQP